MSEKKLISSFLKNQNPKIVILSVILIISIIVNIYFYSRKLDVVTNDKLVELQEQVDSLTAERDSLKGLANLWYKVFDEEVIDELSYYDYP